MISTMTAASNRSIPMRIPSEVQITEETVTSRDPQREEVLPMDADSDDQSTDSGIRPSRLEPRFSAAAAEQEHDQHRDNTMGNRSSSYPSEDDAKTPHRVWQSVKRRIHLINVYIGIDTDEDETYSYLFDDREHVEDEFYLGGYDSDDDDDTVYTASTVASSIQMTPSMEDDLCVKNIGKI